MSTLTFPHDLGLSAAPMDYDWSMGISNMIWSAMDEDHPRLADALDRLGVDAAFGLAVACAETSRTHAQSRVKAGCPSLGLWRCGRLLVPNHQRSIAAPVTPTVLGSTCDQ